MGILAKLLGVASREELKGVSLGRDAVWEVSAARALPSFLRALRLLLPNDAMLYLEGGSPPKEIKTFLDTHCVQEMTHLAMGTIWPKPRVFHLPASTTNLTELATLAEKCATPQIAVHLHVYVQGGVLLEWYDAFWKDPFYLSAAISEDRVRAFSSALGLTYKRTKQNVEPDGPGNRSQPVGPATAQTSPAAGSSR